MLLTEDEDDTVFVSAPTKQAKKARKHSLKEAKEDNRPSAKKHQYCQVWNINILNRVCRELTRLSRSKHTLVKILTIGQLEHP